MAFPHLLQDLYIPIQCNFLVGCDADCLHFFPLIAGKLERDDLEFVNNLSEMIVHRKKLSRQSKTEFAEDREQAK